MRREGYEFAVSKAEVLYKTDENGKRNLSLWRSLMSMSRMISPEPSSRSSASEKVNLQNMGPISGGYTRLEFRIPSRGLIGYRGEFLTDTKGNGIINTIFDGYDAVPW